MFDFRPQDHGSRGSWIASLAVQAALAALFVAGLWRAPVGRERLAPATTDTTLVYLIGPRQAPTPARAGSRAPRPSAPAPVTAPAAAADSSAAAPPAARGITGRIVPGPALGDGALWVGPRPVLPGPIAEQLYGPTAERRDSAAMQRLRAMVDSLNEMLDEERRAQMPPSWTWGGENGGPKWGIDPKWVYLGNIKIPTMALALLGNALPQGNLLEWQRTRELADMRRDLLDAAWRAQTYQDFRRYVKETRERRQQERDEQRRRQTGRDSTGTVP